MFYLFRKIGLVNHSVEQNEAGDAAYQRAVKLAQEMLPNGPVGIKMAKKAINKGMEVINILWCSKNVSAIISKIILNAKCFESPFIPLIYKS